jgi:hypothetical protein
MGGCNGLPRETPPGLPDYGGVPWPLLRSIRIFWRGWSSDTRRAGRVGLRAGRAYRGLIRPFRGFAWVRGSWNGVAGSRAGEYHQHGGSGNQEIAGGSDHECCVDAEGWDAQTLQGFKA